MRNLYRSRDGRVVHSSACYCAPKGGIPWRWAEKQTREYVLTVMKHVGSRPCRICKPFGPDPYSRAS